MSDLPTIGLLSSVAVFAAAAALQGTARARRIAAELAAQPATPPSLYPKINREACICSGACIDACPEREVIAIVAGRPQLVRASACVGHSDCLRSCPVSAIELVLGTPERGVEVPVISSSFETTVPGLYVAGELTGIGLIHNAVEQGKQAARAALASAGAHGCDHDLLIVGAGPAGLGAALEAKHRGARSVVLEKGEFGGAIKSYPRQKIVMSAPFELPGIGKLRLRRTSKEALLELFAEVITRAQLEVVERAEVTAITATSGGFRVVTAARTLTAHRVVLAIGRRGAPRRLGVPGDALAHVIYSLPDPAAYAGQRVAVVGGGDSAVEAALALAQQPGTKVTLVHRGADLGRCKPDNQRALAQAVQRGALVLALATTIRKLTSDRLELAGPAGLTSIAASLVVCCLGAELPSRWLRSLGIQLRELRGQPLC